MDELDEYGAFNTRYEGAGRLVYLPGPSIPIYFEVRQLADGRLLVGCVSTDDVIRENPHAIDGHLLTGEPFTTTWGLGITEIHRSEGHISKAHYLANMTRVHYTKELESNDHSIDFALHNFIPGPNSDISANRFSLSIRDHSFEIVPVGNYGEQAKRLLRYGGNFRTGWIKTAFHDESREHRISWTDLDEVVSGLINSISLAVGTLVSSPQRITYDPKGDRNDVEHYSSDAKPFSKFIPVQGWDTSVKDTVYAWFGAARPIPFEARELGVWIRQHLDACATEMYLETRALAAATLLDVMAGRYSTMWSLQLPHQISFKVKLTRLLRDIGISLQATHLNSIINARNSLVHAGKFVTSESDNTFSEYKNFVRLGRSILLRLIGYPSTLHEAIEG
jgi:hypothetical protein